ncbi:hypothetical protein HGG75_04340 [Ochrobactrum pseudogrignonense]|nr:hypothetical protein [Brucella pseudogrignonensis]
MSALSSPVRNQPARPLSSSSYAPEPLRDFAREHGVSIGHHVAAAGFGVIEEPRGWAVLDPVGVVARDRS